MGLLAGVYVDRHDRQRIMVWTCLTQAVVVGLIAVVIGIDAIALPGLYLLLFLNAGVKQFFDPAHDSLIPEIASDEELAAANSFLSIASFGSTAIGFAGAGLLAGTVGLTWAFIIDAGTFLFAAGCISLMGRHPMPKPEDDASVGVIVDNLKSGMATLFGTPIIRSLFAVGAFMFFSFGLWNVLLLPFSLQVLKATEFQYGLQEGLTSVGFVAGSFFMARFSRLLPEPVWLIVALLGMGVAGVLYGLSTEVGVALILVTITGFFNSPSSVARSVLLQRNTPREMRGRVFSAFYVMRDVIFLLGMASAGLADIVDIRVLIIFSSSLLFVSAAVHVRGARAGHLDVARRVRSPARVRGRAWHRGEPDQGRDAGRLRSPRWADRCIRPTLTGNGARRSWRAPRSARSRAARASSSTATSRPPRTSSSTARRQLASRPRVAIVACRR